MLAFSNIGKSRCTYDTYNHRQHHQHTGRRDQHYRVRDRRLPRLAEDPRKLLYKAKRPARGAERVCRHPASHARPGGTVPPLPHPALSMQAPRVRNARDKKKHNQNHHKTFTLQSQLARHLEEQNNATADKCRTMKKRKAELLETRADLRRRIA